jgi:hypothetical protein
VNIAPGLAIFIPRDYKPSFLCKFGLINQNSLHLLIV